MGTRSLICVVADGKYRVAQYCQWDGYPSGAGLDVLIFLTYTKMKRFRKKINKCVLLNEQQMKDKWAEYGVDPDDFPIHKSVADKMYKKYPQFHRNMGADVLGFIYESNQNLIELKNSIYFAQDSLFCEWCYVIDLDQQTFEVYEGFNKKPLNPNERFYREGQNNDNGYYAVKLLNQYSLNDLPSLPTFRAENEDITDEEAGKVEDHGPLVTISFTQEQIVELLNAVTEVDPNKAENQDVLEQLGPVLKSYWANQTNERKGGNNDG
jgi:hypothetical protein